ncbi:PREDICTED: protein regulator of cytokinesis 1-like [Ceratosolen solmsi marchali]|uniref:Protein regulator of cytokinesis 1-like n=1 Tax=Ceratosolen solmsi marchali TaxID=326594 RepID=A0AAJ7DZN9_9HYME|nr:PREDICTED: protein regulator of cytokinesis 1-like [Ceratosolen solmsi marchali]
MSSIKEIIMEKAKAICEKEISELFKIWDEVGIRKEVLNTYADQVLNHLIGLMKDMVDESNQKKKDLLKNVKALAQSARKFSKELGTNFATDSYDDLPLIELELKLQEQVQQLQYLKNQRLKYIKELVTKEAEICIKIGLKPIGFNSDLLLEQEIKKFESYINIQEVEKNRLTEMFKDSRRSIIKMMEELHINPTLDFEKIIYHDHGNFIYSSNNMTKLKDLKEKLKSQVEQAKLQAQEKKETLISLWDYLDEPQKTRQAFFENYSGYSMITLSALNTEIKRCKEKRRENVATYIDKVRIEIENLWKSCKFSELQKKSFTAMKCQTYTDDLLTLHELEIENLRKYYNSNRKMFELLNEWEIQFEKLKELDQRANDPDRYHNRGGQLLMEEKERKTAEKKLPKLESQLHILVDEYENIHKKIFLIYGFSLREFMNHIRENYEIEKENMKLVRKQAKDRSTKKTPLSTSKRTPVVTSILKITPASNRLYTPGGSNVSRITPSAKRKLPYDISPNIIGNKKRATNTEKNKGTVLCNKVRRSSRIHGTNGSIKVKFTNKKKRKSKNDTTLSVSSYGNFQEHLASRDELRSSVLPEETFKKAGIDMTLIKTPIKPVRRKVLAISTPTSANPTRTLRSTPRNPKLISTRLIPVKKSPPIEI